LIAHAVEPWAPTHPREASKLLASVRAPWWVAGGWALEFVEAKGLWGRPPWLCAALGSMDRYHAWLGAMADGPRREHA